LSSSSGSGVFLMRPEHKQDLVEIYIQREGIRSNRRPRQKYL
jgi:hypothetical protein